jgi:DNA-binding NarL/FixJ family response regulator
MLNTLLAIKEHIRCNNLLICNILKDKELNKLDHLSICTAFNNTESFVDELIKMESIEIEKPKRQYTKKKERKQRPLTQTTKNIITLRNNGKTYQEISNILNIPYKRVWSTINTHKDLINMKEQSNEIQ